MSNRIKSGEIQIGNNYVLPIEQSNVTRQEAKVKKIIEETDAMAQQIISGAENKSQVIVNTASTEAERIIEESRKKAQSDYDSVKQQAYEEGFQKGVQDGFEKFQQDAVEALKSLETLSSSSFDIKKNILDSATLELDSGSVAPIPVTVIVPFLVAFFSAPVVVTVNLYAPGAAVAETVPET